MTPHPAKFNERLLDAIWDVLIAHNLQDNPGLTLLDPFAGTGRVCELRDRGFSGRFVLNELESEWAYQAHETYHPALTIIGDARSIPNPAPAYDLVVTSPCYGNRMADCHTPSEEDTSKRNTYRHQLGRMPSEGSAAVLQWGPEYREFHLAAWVEAHRVMRPGGLMVVNMKDHYRGDERQYVTDWHAGVLETIFGCTVSRTQVPCKGNRQGANGTKRVPYEELLVTRKASS